MANYCTIAQVQRRVGAADLARLADYDDDGAADSAVVTQAIEHACGEIDSYLQTTFVVPLTIVPKLIRRIAIDLTLCELRTGRDSLTEDQQRACDEARKWLDKIVEGKVEIGLTPKPAASAGAPGVRHTSDDRIFGRGEPL